MAQRSGADNPSFDLLFVNPAPIDAIFARFQARNPEPRGELEFSSPFQLLVAVILSAQSTDIGVNKATRRLFALAPDAPSMLQLGEAGIAEVIRSLGLYRNKAKHLMASSRILVETYDGAVPQNRAALESLPGVGRKTANVILNIAFGEPTIAVDTHVFRVARRLGLAGGRTPLAVENDLLRSIPPTFLQHAHHWLILHGRYICSARKPHCGACFLADLCPSCQVPSA